MSVRPVEQGCKGKKLMLKTILLVFYKIKRTEVAPCPHAVIVDIKFTPDP